MSRCIRYKGKLWEQVPDQWCGSVVGEIVDVDALVKELGEALEELIFSLNVLSIPELDYKIKFIPEGPEKEELIDAWRKAEAALSRMRGEKGNHD